MISIQAKAHRFINDRVSSQWVLIYLLGAFVACMIIAGGAFGYLLGNLFIPFTLVITTIAAIQFQVVEAVKRCSRKTVESLPFLYLTRTQEFFLSTNTLETCTGLVILACRAQDSNRLREILRPLCQDYGYDFIFFWLTQAETQLHEVERQWLWRTICQQNKHAKAA